MNFILFPSSMKKTSIIIHQQCLDDAIKALHEEGIMQISEISREEAEDTWNLSPSSAHPETTICIDYEQRLQELTSILQKQRERKTGLKAMLSPSTPTVQSIEDISAEELYSDIESLLSSIEKPILKDHHRLEQINERLSTIETSITHITYFTSFNMALNEIGTSDALVIRIGITERFSDLMKQCNTIEKLVVYSKQVRKGKKPLWSVVIVGHISEKKTIDQLASEYLSDIDVPMLNAKPNDAIQLLNQEKKSLQQKRKDIQKTMKQRCRNHFSDLQALHEQIHLERIRREITEYFAQSQSTMFIKGWVIEEDCSRLEEIIKDSTRGKAVVRFETPSTNPDNPPTHIKTPGWAKSFQTLLELFAVPKYNEINPTVLMGLFFVLFFGIMLGDAGYGSIILILSLIGYIKFGTYSSMIKHWSIMGIMLGIVTIIVGFFTYSIFGNLIHMIVLNDSNTQMLYEFQIGGIQFPIDSLKDPIAILILALMLGIIHMNLGIILDVYQAYKQKMYKEMLTEKLCWIPLQIGGGILIGYFILDWQIAQPVFYLSGILVIIGIIQLLIASGPVGFFDITGFVGDWLSYARLLALGLATAGMALAFNVVSRLLGDMIPVVGIIISILLLIILHIVNLAISALGAGVHSLRLQYVEFFNRFYEGGGDEFTPFESKRTYTQVKKDKT